MNIYRLTRIYQKIRSPRLKALGILVLHMLGKRYLYMAFDPTLSCNLRCRLCYFSNPEKEKSMSERFSWDDINAIAKAVFHRVMRLQIGCGAEPTTFGSLPEIVHIAKHYGVPYVSVCTNGNLLTKEQLVSLADNGLDELILSAHGMTEPIYEYMMRGAEYERFKCLISNLANVKIRYPEIRVRVNFTMCADNIEDLRQMPSVFNSMKPDIIQLRPVQDIGSKAYDNYSMASLTEKYVECVKPIVDFCEENGITLIYPNADNISAIADDNKCGSHRNSVVDMLPYLNLSPYKGWRDAFNPYLETFESYSRRTHRLRFIAKQVFGFRGAGGDEEVVTRAMNYKVNQ